jgi:micrococcal nuclease
MNAKSRALAALLPFWLIVVVAGHACAAEAILGKVVGVSDGDTITVLEKPPHPDSRAGTATQHRIRLFGIDAPESHQAFGSKAKQFASELVFGKQVRVVKQDIDRYGRVVGIVFVEQVCLNEELVRHGFAWVYPQYCKIALCADWSRLEAQARAAKTGLWAHTDPVAPWEFRRAKRTAKSERPPLPPSNTRPEAGGYSGNQKSKVFHQPACKDYDCKSRISSRHSLPSRMRSRTIANVSVSKIALNIR